VGGATRIPTQAPVSGASSVLPLP